MRLYQALICCTLLSISCTPEQPPRDGVAKPVASGTPQFAPLAPAVDSATWLRYRSSAIQAPKARPKLQSKIMAAMAAVHGAELDGQPTNSTPLAAAQWTFVQQTSPDTYMQLGRHIGIRMVDALSAVLNESVRPLQQLRDPKRDSRVRAYIELGGLFIEHADQTGILSDKLKSPRSKALTQALFMRRWAEAVPHRADAWSYVSPEEHRWYLRYLVEAQHKAPLERQLAAIEQLSQIPDYPALLNRAHLFAAAGKLQEARYALKGLDTLEARKLRKRIEALMPK